MKILWTTVLLAAMLCGCTAVPAWETVEDAEKPLVTWAETAGQVNIGVPSGLCLTETTDLHRLYETDDGQWQVETHVFLTTGWEAAVLAVSGFEAQELTVLETQYGDRMRYRFGWCSQTDLGTRVYRADLIIDGDTCYSLVSSVADTASKDYAVKIRQVFSSFALTNDQLI